MTDDLSFLIVAFLALTLFPATPPISETRTMFFGTFWSCTLASRAIINGKLYWSLWGYLFLSPWCWILLISVVIWHLKLFQCLFLFNWVLWFLFQHEIIEGQIKGFGLIKKLLEEGDCLTVKVLYLH